MAFLEISWLFQNILSDEAINIGTNERELLFKEYNIVFCLNKKQCFKCFW